jgi:tetratricopeptide (TPR) repeat protein
MVQDSIKVRFAQAIDAMRSGRFDEANRALEADGGALLKTPAGQNIRGDIFLKQQRHQDALKAFDAAVKLAPSAPEGYSNRGVALLALGRLEEALAAQDRALRQRSDYATAHYNRGNALKALGRTTDAIAAYGRALAARPNYPEALVNRGSALLADGKALLALGDFGRALGLRPDLTEAHIGRASAHRDLAQYDLALTAVAAVLKAEPDNREALRLRYRILLDANRAEEALAEVDAFLVHDPRDAATHRDRATILMKLLRAGPALEAADEAMRLAPTDSDSHVVRGIALNGLGRFEDSLAEFDAAERLGASSAPFFDARGVARATLGDPKDALADFTAALALEPDNAETHYNRAFLWLNLGNWEEGWREHEWRLKIPKYAPAASLRNISPWQGQPLHGKRLLAYGEQGHGDILQFVRFLNLIDRDGAAITLGVPPAIRQLLADSFADIDVAELMSLQAQFDYRISLMSLPAVFGTTLATVPAKVPYLSVDPARVAKWARRIGGHGFRVGVVWQGNRNYTRDRERSVPLTAFAPLAAVKGVRLISVQAMVGLEQLDALPAGMNVERLGQELENNPDGFREMAAIMQNLDLLVMSDTGPTHLAAALGRPVWMATSRHPDWRWMKEREDSPWYPTMRLFRQTTAGDWDSVFLRLAEELAGVVAGRNSPPTTLRVVPPPRSGEG